VSKTTTTDPTPETAKDRQLIYWQQQCASAGAALEQAQERVDLEFKLKISALERIKQLEAVVEAAKKVLPAFAASKEQSELMEALTALDSD